MPTQIPQNYSNAPHLQIKQFHIHLINYLSFCTIILFPLSYLVINSLYHSL